ncbi:hypothetical protein KP509_03G041100 [Ceratopteris richardii]|uniref:NB-ARC domain-containing protein n=1 Tax=Ceratopteris richardii TaxID=49495 RepID=A0A8T2V3D1_CERRI|nr:hypothetical protein KP509_03G041100 [Ceratopteris richardii]
MIYRNEQCLIALVHLLCVHTRAKQMAGRIMKTVKSYARCWKAASPSDLSDPKLPFEVKLSLNEVKSMLDCVSDQLHYLEKNSSAPSSSQHALSKPYRGTQNVSDFMKSLPENMHTQAHATMKQLLSKLAIDTFGAVGAVHWLGLGCTFVGWTLDNLNNMSCNRETCLRLLRKTAYLLRKIVILWEQNNKSGEDAADDALERAAEIACQCAIMCTMELQEQSILLRFLGASTTEDAFVSLEKALDEATCYSNDSVLTRLNGNIPKRIQPTILADPLCIEIKQQEKIKQEAMDYFQNECNGSDHLVAFVLYGIGGAGKSTIGLKIFSEFQKIEEQLNDSGKHRCIRIELPAGVEQASLPVFQQAILGKLNPKQEPPKINDVTDGRAHLQSALKSAEFPVFLYVDNVLEGSHIVDLLPPAACFNPGSQLLVTTREATSVQFYMQDRLVIKRVKSISVNPLSADEARDFLGKLIRGGEAGREEIDVTVMGESTALNEVLKLCGGLHFALFLVAAYVRGQYMNEDRKRNDDTLWKNIASAMKSGEPFSSECNQMYGCLQFSIDTLPSKECKQAFLDIAFMIKNNMFSSLIVSPTVVKFPMDWGEMEQIFGLRHIDVLQSRSLLEMREVYHYSQVILMQPPHIYHHTRDTMKVPVMHDVLMQISMQMVKDGKHDIYISSSSELKELNQFLRDCTSLQRLQLTGWRHLSNVDALENMTTLTCIHFETCPNIQHPSRGLSKLTGLKELSLWTDTNKELYKNKLEGFPDCITLLKALNTLNLLDCENIEALPEQISALTALEVLGFNGSSKINTLPQGISSLIRLKTLSLNGCMGIESLPDGISGLKALQKLLLSGCLNLKSLPHGIASLTELQYLNLKSCKRLETLPDGISRLVNLQFLVVEGCSSLKSIPQGISSLTGLVVLASGFCEELRALPDAISGLSSLQILNLKGCKNLETLPDGVSRLTALKNLDLEECTSLRKLPDGISSLTALNTLSLNGCKKLNALPEGISALRALTTLKLERCSDLRSIPLGFSSLTRLQIYSWNWFD